MEIAVHPGGRTCPRCGSPGAGPGGDDDVGVDQVGELRGSGAGDLVRLRRAGGHDGGSCARRQCSAVEAARGDELAECGRTSDGIGRRSDRRWGTLDPRADAPSPGVPLRRTAVEPGSRDLQRETGSEAMEPGLLVLDEVRPQLAAGRPHDLVVAESEQDVVPPRSRKPSERHAPPPVPATGSRAGGGSAAHRSRSRHRASWRRARRGSTASGPAPAGSVPRRESTSCNFRGTEPAAEVPANWPAIADRSGPSGSSSACSTMPFASASTSDAIAGPSTHAGMIPSWRRSSMRPAS